MAQGSLMNFLSLTISGKESAIYQSQLSVILNSCYIYWLNQFEWYKVFLSGHKIIIINFTYPSCQSPSILRVFFYPNDE